MERYQVHLYDKRSFFIVLKLALLAEDPKDRVLTPDWDHFHILFEQMLHRIPSFGDARLDKLSAGPEAFSPDCKWIVGETPEIRNYFVAAGMKTVSIFIEII